MFAILILTVGREKNSYTLADKEGVKKKSLK